MRQSVVQRLPVAGKQRIDRQEAGDDRDIAFEHHVLAAGAGRPAEGGVEDQQREQASRKIGTDWPVRQTMRTM